VTYAARTMMWSGPILAAFIVYHLLHLTTGTAHQSFSHTDVYANVVAGFRIWYVSAAYIVAMLALGLHLVHGASSIFQSLGLSAANVAGLRRFATVATGAVVVGNISIPLAVLLGFVQ
jgi:succinate dehydrogenase / fumarate reductase cytochrome b subunit